MRTMPVDAYVAYKDERKQRAAGTWRKRAKPLPITYSWEPIAMQLYHRSMLDMPLRVVINGGR